MCGKTSTGRRKGSSRRTDVSQLPPWCARSQGVLTGLFLLIPVCCRFRNVAASLVTSPAIGAYLGRSVWGQLGGGPGDSDSFARYLFYPGCCAGVTTWEDAACVVGSTHFLGTGWPLCGNFIHFGKNMNVWFSAALMFCYGCFFGENIADGILWKLQNSLGEDENKLGKKWQLGVCMYTARWYMFLSIVQCFDIKPYAGLFLVLVLKRWAKTPSCCSSALPCFSPTYQRQANIPAFFYTSDR